MKKFQFSMQKVLDIKEKKREQEEWNFAKILNQLDQEKKFLEELIYKKQTLQEEMFADLQSKGNTMIEINQKNSFLEHLETQIVLQRKAINSLEDELRKKQKEVIDLKIDEKKWLKLKEKKYEKYLYESNQLEQIELDDIANKLIYR